MSNQKKEVIIYKAADGLSKFSVILENETVWLTIDQMAELFNKTRSTINEHILNIYSERELEEDDTMRKIGISDFSTKPTNYYNLDVIISVGYRVKSVQGTRFRQWATQTLKEYITKDFVLDDERLKQGKNFGKDHFDELLARIRDIRASEKRFYQKIRDLFMLSEDYDKTDKKTELFFAEVQNKLLFATTQHTAAEIIVQRAKAETLNMGLTSWKGSRVRKEDVIIAKNFAEKQYTAFDGERKKVEALQADLEDQKAIEELLKKVPKK